MDQRPTVFLCLQAKSSFDYVADEQSGQRHYDDFAKSYTGPGFVRAYGGVQKKHDD